MPPLLACRRKQSPAIGVLVAARTLSRVAHCITAFSLPRNIQTPAPAGSASLPLLLPEYSSTMTIRPQNIGIKAIEIYFPSQVRRHPPAHFPTPAWANNPAQEPPQHS